MNNNNNNNNNIILDEINSELSSMLNNEPISSSTPTPSSISTKSSQQYNIPVNKMDSERLYTISNSLKKTKKLELSTDFVVTKSAGTGGGGLFLSDNDIISIKQPTIGLQTPKILKKLNSMNQHPVSPITTTTSDINPFISNESSFHNKDTTTSESVKFLNYLNNNNNNNNINNNNHI
ncbi:unnamed protein product [[Candida] boidinii]|nr:hypothetical protein BVG19_g4553 [[Candida] boidinii]OWB53304.1 hypothetical protein B5S27_g4897 [[Candida] boidinii]OWB82312.1 hypothetical protein B5S33_g936 [[Candida] boidinii]GMF09355.1 unnamed protein product [[Candida] boidinii]